MHDSVVYAALSGLVETLITSIGKALAIRSIIF